MKSITTPPSSPLSPLETELLKSVSDFEARLTRLETFLKADSATAQAQRTSIVERLQELTKRIVSLECSSASLLESLSEFEKSCADLQKLFEAHKQNYNLAIDGFQAMEKVWQEQRGSYQVLQSQVTRLTGALNSLPTSRKSA